LFYFHPVSESLEVRKELLRAYAKSEKGTMTEKKSGKSSGMAEL
jgi:hypothetical protein